MAAVDTLSAPHGQPTPRVDGPLKVTGRADYASDRHLTGMLFAVPVGSTIGNGTIKSIDASAAERMPGVRAILQRANIGRLFRPNVNKDFSGDAGILDE